MKKMKFFVAVFCCVLLTLSPALATAPIAPVSLIPPGQLGQTIINAATYASTVAGPALLAGTAPLSGLVLAGASAAGIAYYAQTGQNPIYGAASSIASANDQIFVPMFQAFSMDLVTPESYPASAPQYLGSQGWFGAALQDILDYLKNDSPTGSHPLLKQIVDNNSSSPFNFPEGTIVSSPDGKKWKIGPWYKSSNFVHESFFIDKIFVMPNGILSVAVGGTTVTLYRRADADPVNTGYFKFEVCDATLVNDPPTPIPAPGLNHENFKHDFDNAKDNADFADEVRDVLTNLRLSTQGVAGNYPSNIPALQPMSAITPQAVAKYLDQNAVDVAKKAADSINANSTPQEIAQAQAAATAAQAAANAANNAAKPVTETFSPVAINAFTAPYNPGAFDIPLRFTTFIDNVKASPLFSFSQGFFNSIPGGGSPIYHINAGQFGDHTIDLSQTMNGGLAVLKAVLLVCFGFLSIRAVMMKR